MEKYKKKLELINKRLKTEQDLSKRVLLVLTKIDIENKLEEKKEIFNKWQKVQ